MNNLLHVLDTSKVSKHVTDRDDVSILDERVGYILGTLDLPSTDGLHVSVDPLYSKADCTYLFDKVSDLGEKLEQGELKIGSLGSSSSVSRRASNDDSANRQQSPGNTCR